MSPERLSSLRAPKGCKSTRQSHTGYAETRDKAEAIEDAKIYDGINDLILGETPEHLQQKPPCDVKLIGWPQRDAVPPLFQLSNTQRFH